MVPPLPPGPPPRQRPLVPGPGLVPGLQPDVLPPGISRFPPPPPSPDMRPPLSALGIPGQPPPPGMMVPLLPRPPFGLPPGPPPFLHDAHGARPTVPQKPSYIISAASTVVKRPLAQHSPQLTSMVPASVQVGREPVALKGRLKPSVSFVTAAPKPIAAPAVVKQESFSLSSSGKPKSIVDSYTAFLEDMKALGALDSRDSICP